MATEDSINLLLVGKIGAGKSSTGNTIIGQSRLQSGGSQTAVTKECKAENAHVLGRKVKVVDLPGLADAALDGAEDGKKVIEEVMTAVAETPDGYDAILIVIAYGQVSWEDKKIVAQLKEIFGSDFIAEFGIVLITHCDQFNLHESKDMTIKEWCYSEDDILKDLLTECRDRVIFFENKSTDSELKDSQLKHLLSTVDEMKSGPRYLPKHFEDARAERQKLLAESQEQRVLDKIRLIMNDLDGINEQEDPEAAIPKLQDLLGHTEEQRHAVACQNNGKEDLDSALNVIKVVKQAVHNKLLLAKSAQTKRELQNQLANMAAEKEEERQKLRLQLEEKDIKMQEVMQKQEREKTERKYEDFIKKRKKSLKEKIKKVLIASAIAIGLPALIVAVAAGIIPAGIVAPVIDKVVKKIVDSKKKKKEDKEEGKKEEKKEENKRGKKRKKKEGKQEGGKRRK